MRHWNVVLEFPQRTIPELRCTLGWCQENANGKRVMPLTARALLHGKVGIYWVKCIEEHLEERQAYGAIEAVIAKIRTIQNALEAIPRAGKMVCVHEVHERGGCNAGCHVDRRCPQSI